MNERSSFSLHFTLRTFYNVLCQRSKSRQWPGVSDRRTLPWLLLLAHHVRHSCTTHTQEGFCPCSCSHQCVSVCFRDTQRESERHKDRNGTSPFGPNLKSYQKSHVRAITTALRICIPNHVPPHADRHLCSPIVRRTHWTHHCLLADHPVTDWCVSMRLYIH